jgi:hypothetical protein
MSIVTFSEDNVSRTALPQIHESDSEPLSLPVLVTASDVREFVQYLRLKPTGVVAAEELDRSKKRLFDERKLAAYESLGIITDKGGVLSLSDKGWRFARNFAFDAQAFRSMLSQSMLCWSALQWMSEEHNDTITSPELIGYWLKCDRSAFGSFDHEQLKGSVVSFFSFCQGAGLGTMTLGKRGHITRFSVDRVELKRFLEGDGSLNAGEPLVHRDVCQTGSRDRRFKVLLHSHEVEIAQVLQDTFDLVELNSEKIELGWDNVISQKSSFNDSEYALVVVISDDCFDETSRSVSEKVLLGLGAAHVHFENRVIVLAEKKHLLFEKFSHLKCFEFDREQLGWNTGLEIVRELTEMREKCFEG